MANDGMIKYDFTAEETNTQRGINPIRPKSRKSLWIILACIVAVVTLFSIGFLVGYLARQPGNRPNKLQTEDGEHKDFEEFHDMFQQSVSTEELEALIR